MHKVILRRGNSALIAGVLVVLALAGLCQFLWLACAIPFLWIVVIAWLVVPVFPFAIRLVTLRFANSNQKMNGIC